MRAVSTHTHTHRVHTHTEHIQRAHTRIDKRAHTHRAHAHIHHPSWSHSTEESILAIANMRTEYTNEKTHMQSRVHT